MTADSLETLTRGSFSDCVGDRFVLRGDGESRVEIELRLTEANALGGQSDAREPFSLIFVGPSEPVLPQATYSLSHERLGGMRLFLVPLGPDRERTGIQYEAVFS